MRVSIFFLPALVAVSAALMIPTSSSESRPLPGPKRAIRGLEKRHFHCNGQDSDVICPAGETMTADDPTGYGLLKAKGLAGPDGTDTIISPGPNGGPAPPPPTQPSPSASPSPSPPAPSPSHGGGSGGEHGGHWECGGEHNSTHH